MYFFKKNISNYNTIKEKSILKNSIEMYKNNILPLTEEIRNLKNGF